LEGLSLRWSAPACGGPGTRASSSAGPKIDADIEGAIKAALRRKERPGVRVIATAHGVSVGTVQRIAHAR
jgi:hypothetical protein